ncbi:TetR/AcrR family transcriptional regulator [Nonomuraea roseoviolacea subsp. roseoviolacea]|uniref:AcrR family transcriptional regulator n=1 Tax=Nonomuraea roseoviolacea subsp. carminata TaxID=160689 RepID=A0ABT1KHL5_9ACTN|nr:TetR/AcrR family transcriptional regulator [Nonomuraea roseoviolacea]MCP2352851.1 AcrR family transcriptional regulator [Nonomuraea roseoviolacea subsp. carminata]
MGTTRTLRADAERSMRMIMTAAEELFGVNPAATMEQIAEAAGVSRVTVHRRFASREALVEAMETTAWQEVADAVEAARPETAPPAVVLHQATANILQIKTGWRYILARPVPTSEAARAIREEVTARCERTLARAKEEGLLGPHADIGWARQAYLALLAETAHTASRDADPDVLAARVIDTLLHGLAGR